MPKISDEEGLTIHREMLADAWAEREKWVPMWTRLAENFYPIQFAGLSRIVTSQEPPVLNTKLVDNAPATALGVLAAGYMNGVTSPARKWLKIGRPAAKPFEEPDHGQTGQMSAIQRKLLEILAEGNYYSTRAVQVYEGSGLGSSLVLAYEDRDTVVRFLQCSPGTFAFATDDWNQVVAIGRKFQMRLRDILREFGDDGLGPRLADIAKGKRANSRQHYTVCHWIEANADDGLLTARTPFREFFWLEARASDAPRYLAKRPLYEWPASIFRWDCPDSSTYGVPPTASCVGRAIQLQTNEYKTDQGLDKQISPPMLAHVSLKGRPKAFSANGITYTHDLSANSGARPVHNFHVPFAELDMRRKSIVLGIEEALFNPLFKSISQLETVRSATEIDARREEKLVMLGPVLHRNYAEDLRPLIMRVYGIAKRKGVMPELGQGEEAALTFHNILSDVQKASDVSSIERFFQFTGAIVGAYPQIQPEVDASFLTRQYAEGLGLDPRSMVDQQAATEAQEAAAQMAQLQQVSELAKNFGSAAGAAGKVDVGGGMNAVQAML